jgi:hypothetical protein
MGMKCTDTGMGCKMTPACSLLSPPSRGAFFMNTAV